MLAAARALLGQIYLVNSTTFSFSLLHPFMVSLFSLEENEATEGRISTDASFVLFPSSSPTLGEHPRSFMPFLLLTADILIAFRPLLRRSQGEPLFPFSSSSFSCRFADVFSFLFPFFPASSSELELSPNTSKSQWLTETILWRSLSGKRSPS